MIIGRRSTPSLTAEQLAEQQRSEAEIQAGRLPLVSRTRLEAAAEDAPPFGSDLSSADFAAVVAAGYLPAGQVFGAAVVGQGARYYRHPAVGFGPPLLDRPTSMPGWFDAQRRARSLALGRLIDEVNLLDADGAIGLRVLHRRFGAADVAEVSLVATAVRRRDRVGVRANPESTFITEMDGKSLAGLQRQGLRPYGPVFVRERRMICGVRVGVSTVNNRLWGNQELSGPTALMNDARDFVAREMASAARRLHAAGAVLHDLDVDTEFGECVTGATMDWIADVHATATVIGPIDRRARAGRPAGSTTPRAVVPL